MMLKVRVQGAKAASGYHHIVNSGLNIDGICTNRILTIMSCVIKGDYYSGAMKKVMSSDEFKNYMLS